MPRNSAERPRVDVYSTRVHAAAPQAIWLARMLGRIAGRGINGRTGTVLYGMPAIGTRYKFQGYASPPQLFTGYSPQRVAAGAIRVGPGSLPSTSSPTTLLNSPLQRATATVAMQQQQNPAGVM